MASFYMIFSDEDDEEFGDQNNTMAPPPEESETRTNFSKLFGTEQGESEDDDDKSLKYNPNKQEENYESIEWNVIFAKVVTAYKLINQTNTVIGKCGFALLLSEKSDLKAIIYRTKNQLFSTLLVKSSATIFVKTNFIQYMDSNQTFWSVLFENASDRDEALRILEERCTVQKEDCIEEIKEPLETKPSQEPDGDANAADTSDKACETDPEEKQTKQIKANILSRMARMGKKMIVYPNKTSTSEVSDSSDNDSPKHKPSVSPRKAPPPIVARQIASAPETALQIAKLQPGPMAHTYTVKNDLSSSAISLPTDGNMNLMLMQNTEIRFNISKLEGKVDKILDKIDLINVKGSGSSTNIPISERNLNINRDEELLKLEEKILVIKKENLLLKSKVCDLEDSTNSTDHSKELEQLKINFEALKQEHINISVEKDEEIENLRRQIQDINEKHDIILHTKDADIGELQSELNVSKRLIQDLTVSLQKYENGKEVRYKETQTDFPEQESQSSTTLEPVIKDIMNSLYFKLCEKLASYEEKDLKQSEILRVIGQTIKQETSEVLRNIQK